MLTVEGYPSFLGYAGPASYRVSSIAWQGNNIRVDTKRAVVSTLQIMISGGWGNYTSLKLRSQISPL